MLKILKYFRKHEWFLFIFTVVTVIGQVFCTLTLPDYISEVISDLIGNPDPLNYIPPAPMSQIWKSGGLIALLALAIAVFAMLSNFSSAKLSADFTAHLRNIVFEKVESFSMEELNRFSTPSLITRSTNDIQQIANMFSMGFKFLIMTPLMAIYAIVKIINRSRQLSLLTAAGIIILAVFIVCLFVFVMPKFKRIQQLIDNVNGVMRENLTGLRVVRAYNAEGYQENKFENVNTELTDTNLFINRLMVLMDPLMQFVMNAMNLGVMWLGAYLIDKGTLDLPVVTAFSMYAMHVIMSFMFLTVTFIMLPRASVSAKRVMEILQSENKIKDPDAPQTGVTHGEVEFQNVCFKFHDSGENVLTDISFTAHEGETVAIVGGTGSGKSAIVNLIPRFYDVCAGKVLVDGTDVRDYAQKDLRDKIGYVSQRAVLFSGTINSNIVFGDKEIPDQKIKEAATVAQAVEFINNKEEGYSSPIAQGGSNVSGGQKQRLSIARAVAKDPEIYIFDDSFSALDYKTDKALRAALKNYTQKATSIIVAQRIGTVMDADKILVINDGRIVGSGKHSELMKNCEVYREIAYSQLSKEELENA